MSTDKYKRHSYLKHRRAEGYKFITAGIEGVDEPAVPLGLNLHSWLHFLQIMSVHRAPLTCHSFFPKLGCNSIFLPRSQKPKLPQPTLGDSLNSLQIFLLQILRVFEESSTRMSRGLEQCYLHGGAGQSQLLQAE